LTKITNAVAVCNGDMTSNDLYAKVNVIHIGTTRFLIYEFL